MHGNRLSREEIKAINARLNGHLAWPLKHIVKMPDVAFPHGWIPNRRSEDAAAWVREDRLDLLQRLGEQMIEAAQEP